MIYLVEFLLPVSIVAMELMFEDNRNILTARFGGVTRELLSLLRTPWPKRNVRARSHRNRRNDERASQSRLARLSQAT